MKRSVLSLVIGAVLGAVGMAAVHDHEDGESVKVLKTHDIKEKIDGKDASVTMVEVIVEPGKSGLPHRHPGSACVYVAEGKYELGVDDQPTKIFEAGQTFSEPAGCLHRVSKNPAQKGRTRLIAFVLHPREAKEVAIPEKTTK